MSDSVETPSSASSSVLSLDLLREAAILLGCTLSGEWVAPYLPLPLPGSIIGMALLFILLATGVVKLDWVERASSILIRYMAVLFVPLGVGLVAYLDVLESGLLPFAVSTVVSTFVTMIVVALVFDRSRS